MRKRTACRKARVFGEGIDGEPAKGAVGKGLRRGRRPQPERDFRRPRRLLWPVAAGQPIRSFRRTECPCRATGGAFWDAVRVGMRRAPLCGKGQRRCGQQPIRSFRRAERSCCAAGGAFLDAVRVGVRRVGRAVVRRAVMARDGFSAWQAVAARGGFSAAAAFAAVRCGRRPFSQDERRKKAFARNDGQRLRKRWEHADLNRRPPACRAGALNQLSYAPCIKKPSSRGMVGKTCGS